MSTGSPTGMGKDCESNQRGEKPNCHSGSIPDPCAITFTCAKCQEPCPPSGCIACNPPVFDPVFTERVRCAVLVLSQTNLIHEAAAIDIAKEILRGDGK